MYRGCPFRPKIYVKEANLVKERSLKCYIMTLNLLRCVFDYKMSAKLLKSRRTVHGRRRSAT